MKKIIYLSVNENSKKISRDFFINQLKKVAEVDFWSIKNLFNKQDKKKNKFNNLKDFEKEIRKKKKNLFVNIMPVTHKTYPIFKILTDNKINYININWGFLPGIKISFFYKFIDIVKNFNNFYKSFIYKLFFKKKIKLPIKTFVAGSLNYKKNFIKLNLCDHDQYLILKSNKSKRKHIVFLDQAITSHSDTFFNKKKNLYNNHKYYYKSLNLFFAKLENKHKKKVVISKHPLNQLNKNLLNGRKHFLLKTSQLVKDSSLVIAHDTLSSSYAIFNYKPIIFIYTNQIKKYSIDTFKQYLQVKILAEELGCKFVNIDQFTINDLIIKPVNKKLYDNFKYKYLVSKKTENKLSSEIFIKNLIKISEKI